MAGYGHEVVVEDVVADAKISDAQAAAAADTIIAWLNQGGSVGEGPYKLSSLGLMQSALKVFRAFGAFQDAEAQQGLGGTPGAEEADPSSSTRMLAFTIFRHSGCCRRMRRTTSSPSVARPSRLSRISEYLLSPTFRI